MKSGTAAMPPPPGLLTTWMPTPTIFSSADAQARLS
jgi:hypothetical protein